MSAEPDSNTRHLVAGRLQGIADCNDWGAADMVKVSEVLRKQARLLTPESQPPDPPIRAALGMD